MARDKPAARSHALTQKPESAAPSREAVTPGNHTQARLASSKLRCQGTRTVSPWPSTFTQSEANSTPPALTFSSRSTQRARPPSRAPHGSPVAAAPRPLTPSAVAVTPVHLAAGVPVEAPGSARAVRTPAKVVALPSQLRPARRGRPREERRHVYPAQTRSAGVCHVGPGRAGGAVPGRRPGRAEAVRARGAERRRGVQGAREWGRQCLLWPPLDGKVIRVLGTPRGRMVMAVVEGITEDRIKADHSRERPENQSHREVGERHGAGAAASGPCSPAPPLLKGRRGRRCASPEPPRLPPPALPRADRLPPRGPRPRPCSPRSGAVPGREGVRSAEPWLVETTRREKARTRALCPLVAGTGARSSPGAGLCAVLARLPLSARPAGPDQLSGTPGPRGARAKSKGANAGDGLGCSLPAGDPTTAPPSGGCQTCRQPLQPSSPPPPCRASFPMF